MTKEELAAMLNGRKYRKELTGAEEAAAKAAGLLVIFGASDDLLEFRGAFTDEVGAYGGADVLACKTRALPSWEELEKDEEAEVQRYFADKATAVNVTADWDVDGYSWVVTAAAPYATFDIMDDGDKYCRGIVLSMADIAAARLS